MATTTEIGTGEKLLELLEGQRSEEEILRLRAVAAHVRRSLNQELAAARSRRRAAEIAGRKERPDGR